MMIDQIYQRHHSYAAREVICPEASRADIHPAPIKHHFIYFTYIVYTRDLLQDRAILFDKVHKSLLALLMELPILLDLVKDIVIYVLYLLL